MTDPERWPRGRRNYYPSAWTIGPDGYYGSGFDWGHPLIRPPSAPSHRKPAAPVGNVVDAERVGALLDGRLDGEEREAALLELAASEDDGTVFHDTAAVLREAEEAEAAEAGRIAPP